MSADLGFQHSPRDLAANINEWKIMFDPYNASQWPTAYDFVDNQASAKVKASAVLLSVSSF